MARIGVDVERARQSWDLSNLPIAQLAERTTLVLMSGEIAVGVFEGSWWVAERSRSYDDYRITSRSADGRHRVLVESGFHSRHLASGELQLLKLVDRGQVHLTTKRLVLAGSSRSRTIRLTQIVQSYRQPTGVDVTLASGLSPFIEIDGEVHRFATLLERVRSGDA